MSLLHQAVRQDPFEELSRFRGEFYSCLTRRADALFELADAVLCADGPVRSLVELSLVGEHRRGHGGLYDALAAGRVEVARLRRALAAVPLPRADHRPRRSSIDPLRPVFWNRDLRVLPAPRSPIRRAKSAGPAFRSLVIGPPVGRARRVNPRMTTPAPPGDHLPSPARQHRCV
ncbi:transposase [Streptomyces parvus]|uniref:transposase n=1 Tax=Streptomyces parvus TaxID=66428 RepID=UPI0034261826